MIRTVLGDLAPDQLGATYTHEHLSTRPAERLRDGGDMVLDREDLAVEELERFAGAGGGAIVELTAPELGRNPAALRRLSEQSGVHIVATTGHICESYWAGVLDIDGRSEATLIREMVHDLTVGMDGTDIRAGIIKCGSSHDEITAAEARVIRAAARAQQETGAPITTHTTAGTVAEQQLQILSDAGADLSHVCLGHLDRRLDWDVHVELARAGVYLGYDCFSKDWYEPDGKRVEFVLRFIEQGHGDQLLVASDLARRSYLTAWGGGPGFTHILWRIVPWLRREGATEPQLTDLLVTNPARFLDWR